jgi:hypothetical protein
MAYGSHQLSTVISGHSLRAISYYGVRNPIVAQLFQSRLLERPLRAIFDIRSTEAVIREFSISSL